VRGFGRNERGERVKHRWSFPLGGSKATQNATPRAVAANYEEKKFQKDQRDISGGAIWRALHRKQKKRMLERVPVTARFMEGKGRK